MVIWLKYRVVTEIKIDYLIKLINWKGRVCSVEWCLSGLCDSIEVLGDPTGEVTLEVEGVL
jgi:hypothetical protein